MSLETKMNFSRKLRLIIAVVLVIVETYSCTNDTKIDTARSASSNVITEGNMTDRLKVKQQHFGTGMSQIMQTNCKFYVTKPSRRKFKEEILNNRYNFMYLRLNFHKLDIKETQDTIDSTLWVWTYKGEYGANQYLFLPGDFGYLSFGILWSYTRLEELHLTIDNNGHCSNATVGEIQTDQAIANALGNMTADVAAHNREYNSSYWCYNHRLWLGSETLYTACKYTVCTFQTFEFKCCKYKKNHKNMKLHVDCHNSDYEFGELWWMLPIIIGKLCFAFYPILLTKFGCRFSKFKKRMARSKSISSNGRSSPQVDIENDTNILHGGVRYSRFAEVRYIRSHNTKPVSFMATICAPLIYCCNFNGLFFSRVVRILLIFLSMGLSTIRVILDYKYAKVVITEAVRKDALVGFSSIIAGFEESRQKFLYVLGGPAIAIVMYVVFGSLLISVPTNLECMLTKGVFKGNIDFYLLLSMHITQKEKLGGVFVSEYSGYKKLHNYLLVQSYMLLNWQFWKLVINVFINRWVRIFGLLKNVFRVFGFAYLFSLFLFPFYVLFCILELLLSLLYFAFPVISCFFVVLGAFSINCWDSVRQKHVLQKLIRSILIAPMIAAFCIFWYMFCILFFDGFWFLSKISMFTYSGIIAYPKLSYGYLVLTFMAVYYLVESINKFGSSYRELLIISIEACKDIQIKSRQKESGPIKILHNKGIPIDLYHLIIERHMPRRVQVCTTLLKFVFVVSLLAVSIELLITFDKFRELSLVSHVFTVIFICALPKIIRIWCVDTNQYKTKQKLRKKIQRTVYQYLYDRDPDTRTNLTIQ